MRIRILTPTEVALEEAASKVVAEKIRRRPDDIVEATKEPEEPGDIETPGSLDLIVVGASTGGPPAIHAGVPTGMKTMAREPTPKTITTSICRGSVITALTPLVWRHAHARPSTRRSSTAS